MKVLKLKSVNNFRDLGETRLSDGTVLPVGKYLRGKTLYHVSRRDIEFLVKEYGLKTIIDLRTNQEIEEKPNPVIDGVTFLHMPICDEATAGITREYGTRHINAIVKLPEMNEVYKSLADEKWLDNFAAVVNKILSLKDDELPVLFHCSAGKDRTGIVAALLLYYFGASEEDILEDYLYTNISNRHLFVLAPIVVFLAKFSVKLAKKAKISFSADEKFFNAFFDEIKKKYGSVQNFISLKIKEPADKN